MTESPSVPPPLPSQPGSPQPSPQPAQEQWYYSVGGMAYGPVPVEALRGMFAANELHPGTPVWCEGLAGWVHPCYVPGLLEGLNVPPGLWMRPEQFREARRLKNAKTNALALFVMFAIQVVLLVWHVASAYSSRRGRGDVEFDPVGQCWLGLLVLTSQLFALIYVPLRWRALRALPRPYRTMGLVGGIWLIATFFLAVFALIVARATGWRLL